MGVQCQKTIAGAAPVRRAKPFFLDDQTRFLYFILKQLDLKTVNWQQVADDLGIKNGHAARMRWSRFKGHVEGVPGAPRNRKGDGKGGRSDKTGKGVDLKMGMKRCGDGMDGDDDGDNKRLKIEQGWLPIRADYRHGVPSPYHPGPSHHGTSLRHQSPFGRLPQSCHFHSAPRNDSGQAGYHTHGQPILQPPPPQFTPATTAAPETVNPVLISKSKPAVSVKLEPESKPIPEGGVTIKTELLLVKIEPEPAKKADTRPSRNHTDPQVIAEHLEQTARSPSSVVSTHQSSSNALPAPRAPATAAVANARKSPEECATKESAKSTNTSQNVVSASTCTEEVEAVSNTNQSGNLPAITEVSKEDFAKAIDGEAANHTQPVYTITPSSSELHLSPARAHTILHLSPSSNVASAVTNVSSITDGPVARASAKTPPAGVPRTPIFTSAAQPSAPNHLRAVSQHQSPRIPSVSASAAPLLPPAVSPHFHTNAPPAFTHLYASPFAPPPANYPHLHFPHPGPPYPSPRPYWRQIPHINNPPPTSSPTHHGNIADWSRNPHPFGPNSASNHVSMPAHPHSRSPASLAFREIWTPSNPPPLTPMNDSGHEMGQCTLHVPAMNELDLTHFDFGAGVANDIGMDMSEAMMDVGRMAMEPQFVVPAERNDGVGAGAGAIACTDAKVGRAGVRKRDGSKEGG